MKFNFDDYKGKYVMHCKTREEARSFCDYFRREKNPRSYYGEINTDIFQSKTAYNFNEELIGDVEFYSSNGYKVLEWSDFMSDTVTNKDRINKVFEILGVKPNECFKIKGRIALYRIDDDLKLYSTPCGETEERNLLNTILIGILKGTETIIHLPTKEEQIAIDYALACGYSWIAKDKDGTIYAYKEKPQKESNNGIWVDNDGNGMLEFELPISFLYWDDEEPYYIGD